MTCTEVKAHYVWHEGTLDIAAPVYHLPNDPLLVVYYGKGSIRLDSEVRYDKCVPLSGVIIKET